MDKIKNYRYFFFLLIGGFVCSVLTGFPIEGLKLIHDTISENINDSETVETMALSDNTILVSGDSIFVSENTDCVTEDRDKNDYKTENRNDKVSVSKNAVANQSDDKGGKIKKAVFGKVEDNYFDDAVFIGDSRVVSLYEYAGWEKATFYCSSGMTLGGVFEDPTGKWKDGNWKVNIATALQQQQYKKVYIMLGINDMGVGDLDYFVNHYTDMVLQIREWQPDAVIYIMSIMNVSKARDEQGDYINNEAIRARNEKLKALDNGVDIIYLDVNSVVCDASGYLNEEYTFDGVHLYAKYVVLWTNYLKENAVIEK